MTTPGDTGSHPTRPEDAARPERPSRRETAPPLDTRRDSQVDVSVAGRRRDPVRWSSVWAGLLVALATFILVELLFFSFGWLTLAQGDPDTTAGLISALIGLLAFFVGGMIAGGTSIWRGVREGVVHGVLVWALGLVGILFLTLFGGGALLGSASEAFAQLASLRQANLPDVQASQALDTARGAAGWGVLGLVLSLVAAVTGGVAGVKMGSGKTEDGSTDVNVH